MCFDYMRVIVYLSKKRESLAVADPDGVQGVRLNPLPPPFKYPIKMK